ncbi:MAG: beta-carotene ketolase [Calditrichaeota bacterium]|nr:MAG: beta-carotene ketolase [Calditrichota bacterium]
MKPEIQNSSKGLFFALIILASWIGSLIFLLNLNLENFTFVISVGILLQTFLYTGIFITAHDSMHRTVFPKNLKINNLIGSISLTFYALFSFKSLREKHWEHHRNPVSGNDPDFHDGKNDSFFTWYWKFFTTYISWKQILGMAIIFNIFEHLIKIDFWNLILFWILPSILSTFQLFYFGTFLPHRKLVKPFKDSHNARSNDYSTLWSFLTCYHFGYHWEHHEFPNIPWWHLPKMR